MLTFYSPERGSFPLDHDAECKHLIASYLKCLKSNRGVNQDECRLLARGYLSCRMDRNLMARDEWRNLGLPEPDDGKLAEADMASGLATEVARRDNDGRRAS